MDPKGQIPDARGLDVDLAAKRARVYDQAAENEVAGWVEAITQKTVMGNLAEALHSGEVLCELANVIKPGSIPKIHHVDKGPFKPIKERENITFFQEFVRSTGVHEHSMFSTNDLYDGKGMMTFITCMQLLGGRVQLEFPDIEPKLGVIDNSEALREEKRRRFAVSQSEGLAGTLERPPVDTSRSIVPIGEVTSDVDDEVEVPLGPDGLPLYGLDAEIREKEATKLAAMTSEEAQVCAWIEEIMGVEIVGRMAEELRSGMVLCKLLNEIKPGCITKMKEPGEGSFAPMRARENISLFLRACRDDFGLQEHSVFSTQDLYDERDMGSVITCLYLLGGAVQKLCPDFEPKCGLADCSEVMREERRPSVCLSQTAGFYGTLARSHIDTSKSITKNMGGATTTDESLSLIGKGSADVMERPHIDMSNSIAYNTGGATFTDDSAPGLVSKGAAGVMERTLLNLSHGIVKDVGGAELLDK